LKLEEVCDFSVSKNIAKIKLELEDLVNRKVIYKIEDFYLAVYDPSSLEKRKKGNQMAVTALITAEKKAAFIAKFPFVEAVAVSGSLSKGYYDNESDIDFFVITKPGKLWVCRTLLMLYKKIFLLNSRKFFCINYFMSSSDLEIEEKNRFTATEIKTLIPFQGKIIFTEFYKKNGWVSDVFGTLDPNLEMVREISKPKTIKIVERFLNTHCGRFLDNVSQKITVRFWKIRFGHMKAEEFNVALKSTKNVSKHHPSNFQKKVINSLNEKYEEVRMKHNIELPKEYV
jgi:predicted nucleotidyltransferase